MEIIYSLKGIIGTSMPKWGISLVEKADLKKLLMDFSLWWNDYILENIGRCGIQFPPNMKNPKDPKEMYGLLKPIYTECHNRGIKFPVAHAPQLNPNTKRHDLNDFLYELTEECIRISRRIGCKYLIVPPLFAGISHNELWNVNAEYYRKLVNVAKEMDLVLLIKNQCRDMNGHLVRGMFCDAQETIEFIDMLNAEFETEILGFCLDTGICNLCGQDMYDFTNILGKRLKAVILRDNDGYTDSSLLPFTSTCAGGSRTDWRNLICGLRNVEFDGSLIFDFSNSICAYPNMVRQKYLGITKDMGIYFKWQLEMETRLKRYSSIVLFGAGNMCRNYMKCYGEKYSPLFTCDNNRNIWNTEFCGLMVKDPQNLKKLPEDCAIFICNIYYSEIKEQILEMGVDNPIEYFNDEYMPAFYFGRTEMKEIPIEKRGRREYDL